MQWTIPSLVVVAVVVVGIVVWYFSNKSINQNVTDENSKLITTKQEKTDDRPSIMVRYIRIQRVTLPPATFGNNSFEVKEVKVFINGYDIPITGGIIRPEPASPEYGWERVRDGYKDKDNMAPGAAMPNVPDASITLDLGREQIINKIVVWNSPGDKINQLLGCELQILDGRENVVRKWAFTDVNATQAVRIYTVGVETDFKLTRLDE